MTYDPTTGYIILVSSYNGNEGLFAIDKSGNLKWSDSNIWIAGNPNGYTNLRMGVDVPRFGLSSAECRITVVAGDGYNGYYGGIARYSPSGGINEKNAGWFTYNGQYGASGSHGCLVPPTGSVTDYRWVGFSDGHHVSNYMWFADMGSSF